ncbi:MAG: hypothetical protein D8M61_20050 [Ignavibacteriae bacterium]|nr:hypothetical protein [Ignavibacteriota bacterium]
MNKAEKPENRSNNCDRAFIFSCGEGGILRNMGNSSFTAQKQLFLQKWCPKSVQQKLFLFILI